MKYYTEQDVKDIVCYIAGWTIGTYKQGKDISGEIVIQEMKKIFKPRNIADLFEKPYKDERKDSTGST